MTLAAGLVTSGRRPAAPRGRAASHRGRARAPPRSTSATPPCPRDPIVEIDGDLEALNDSDRGHRDGARAVASGVPALPRAGDGELVATMREVFAKPGRDIAADDEVFPLAADSIDLGPAVHDALALELPLAPLCRDACAGLCPTCGVDRNHARCCVPSRPTPTHAGLRSTCSSLPPTGAVRPRLCWSLACSSPLARRIPDGRPQEEDLEGEEPQPAGVAPGRSTPRPAASAPGAAPPSCRTSCAATAAGTTAARPSTSTDAAR